MPDPQSQPANAQPNLSWWLTSIAMAVVCCAVLFILFASYLVELKDQVKDDGMRINAIERREASTLATIEALNKKIAVLQTPPVAAVPAGADAGTPPAAPTDNAAPPAPETPPEASPPVSEPAPAVTVPVIPAPSPAPSPASPPTTSP